MSTQRENEVLERQTFLARSDTFKRGDVYRHYKGGLYVILAVGLMEGGEDELDEAVTYQNLETGWRWVRPKKQWFETAPNGQIRFTFTGNTLPL